MNYLKVNLELHQLNIVWRFLVRAVTGDKNKSTTGYIVTAMVILMMVVIVFVVIMHLSTLQGVLEH